MCFLFALQFQFISTIGDRYDKQAAYRSRRVDMAGIIELSNLLMYFIGQMLILVGAAGLVLKKGWWRDAITIGCACVCTSQPWNLL